MDEDSLSQQPPFSAPSEQYGPLAETTTPHVYQEQSSTPDMPPVPVPGGVAPPTPTLIVPPPPVDPNAYAQPVPVVSGKKRTVRDIVLLLIVFCLIVSGLVVVIVLRYPQLSTQPFHATAPAHVAANSYPSYLPGHGHLALSDPLQYAQNWDDDQAGHCRFENNAYHVRSLTNNILYNCLARSDGGALDHATDSAFEVQMTIVQGDCGSLALRDSLSAFEQQDQFYFVNICQDGYYGLFKYNVSHQGYDILRGFAYSAVIKQGLNQPNSVDVVAQGSNLGVWVNGEPLAHVQDTSLTQGTFGLGVSTGDHHVTEVVYREARIWTL